MCERRLRIINLSEIKFKLGKCYVNTERGFISIRKIELNKDKINYLRQIAVEDDTVHSREYYRFKVFYGIKIVHD